MEGNDIRAELSALIQMTSSLSLSSRGMTLLVSLEMRLFHVQFIVGKGTIWCGN